MKVFSSISFRSFIFAILPWRPFGYSSFIAVIVSYRPFDISLTAHHPNNGMVGRSTNIQLVISTYQLLSVSDAASIFKIVLQFLHPAWRFLFILIMNIRCSQYRLSWLVSVCYFRMLSKESSWHEEKSWWVSNCFFLA